MRLLHTTGCHSRYIVTASELSTMDIQLPEIQRELCEEHVEEIMAHQRHLHGLFGYYLFTGSLVICRCNHEMHLVDGQHRREAAKRLYQADPLSDFELACEVIQCKNMEQVLEWFQLVNSNRPLPSYLLADTAAASSQPGLHRAEDEKEEKVQQKTLKDHLLELRQHMKRTYADYLSKSGKPQKPNVHLDDFLEAVGKRYGATLLQLDGNATATQWLEAENRNHLATLTNQRAHEQVDGALKRIAAKPNGPPFYLGSYWLDSVKNSVSAPLRRIVWQGWYAEQPAEAKSAKGEIACPCCSLTLISAQSFHAGHKRSFKNGGTNSADNLIPLCAGCNTSMGVMNFEAYRAVLRGE